MIYFGGITGFFIIFIIIIEALFNNIFNQLAFIFGLILAILFFLMILIIDYIVFNELKFLVYGKKLGMPFSEISLLLLDIKLNASKEKDLLKPLEKINIRERLFIMELNLVFLLIHFESLLRNL